MQKKYSNLQNRKSSQIKQLQRLDEQNKPAYKFISPKFAQPLAITAVFMYLNQICCKGLAILNPYRVVYLPENSCNQEIVSDQNRVLLVGVETEDISVQLFEYAVSREG